MHLAAPTSPAHVAVSSDIMEKSFSATCYTLCSRPYAPPEEVRL
jgi:hypothetical protein